MTSNTSSINHECQNIAAMGHKQTNPPLRDRIVGPWVHCAKQLHWEHLTATHQACIIGAPTDLKKLNQHATAKTVGHQCRVGSSLGSTSQQLPTNKQTHHSGTRLLGTCASITCHNSSGFSHGTRPGVVKFSTKVAKAEPELSGVVKFSTRVAKAEPEPSGHGGNLVESI